MLLNEVVYDPPALPNYIHVELRRVTGAPSNQEVASVHTALRISESFANVPSIFDANAHTQLSQHLFDLQFARHVQRSITKQPASIAPDLQNPVISHGDSNNANTNDHPDTTPRVITESTEIHRVAPEQSNPAIEAAIHQNPNENSELRRTNELMVEIRDALKNVNRVLVGTQNSLARGFNSSTCHGDYGYDLGAHSLINDRGEVPDAHGLPTFRAMDAYDHENASFSAEDLSGGLLARYLRFYGIGNEVIEEGEELEIKHGELLLPSNSTTPAAVSNMPLPSDFLYGYATASYQIEGGRTDGKGDSIWDTFAHKEGKIVNGETGDVACDSYHRYKEDVALLKQFGATTYRFSLSWPRIIPLGGRDDPINEAGITYYNNLIDELVKEGIAPMVTLYHWDLPQALDDKYSGWLDKQEILLDFERYARVCFERFGDRVKHWITLNEPWCVAALGYAIGWLAPGRTSDRKKSPVGDTKTEPWIVGHSLLVAHAKAVKLYREEFKSSQKGQIGITLNSDWAEPYDESPEAKDAASRRLDMNLGWFAGPIYLGSYPESMKHMLGDRTPVFTPEEQALVLNSSDFFGLNSYTTNLIKAPLAPSTGAAPDASLTEQASAGGLPDSSTVEVFACVPDTQVGCDGKLIGRQSEAPWLVSCPWGFRKLLRYINEKYIRDSGLVIMITEQGFPVWREHELPLEKIIDDKDRQEYFAGYLGEVLAAVEQDGIKVGSYVAWSLIDNFEWAVGYDKRFGCAYIDHKNGHKRIPKDSGKWLREWFKKNVAN